MNVEKPLPEWVKQKILEKVRNKRLAEEAFKYITVVEKEDGSFIVKENFDQMQNHALWFTVLTCMNYAQRILRGENIDYL